MLGPRNAAIIPLGPESLRDSSSLPEGQSARSCERNAYGPGQPSPPIWPCSTRGFPCPGCCHPGGELLPHLFTLAKCARPKEACSRFFREPVAAVQASPAVSFLWHFPWPSKILRSRRWQLRGTPRQPPGVTRRVALPWPALASSPRPESGLSSRPGIPGPAITRLTRHH